jgi:SAM-dependent methyltransferase
MSEALDDYRSVWNRKPVLRLVYADFYDRIVRACLPGTTIEIGGGIGNLKARLSDVIATDIQFAPWLDCVADAQRLPFAAELAANIVMVDVLHHVEFPAVFFGEAERVLRPGGRIVMVEPAITWGSSLFYRLLHHEPVVTSADPLVIGSRDPERDPYASNQAIPTLIATRDRERFHLMFPRLRIDQVDWFSLVVYPLTGGFKPWSLISEPLVRRMLRLERVIEPVVGQAMAFRMMLVVEKKAAAH